MAHRFRKKQACFLPTALKPAGLTKLVRLGSDHDGGYAVSADAVASTRQLLTTHIGENCDFEYDFAAMGRLDGLACHDGAVDLEAIEKRYRQARLLSLFRPGEQKAFLAFHKQFTALFAKGRPGFTLRHDDIGAGDDLTPLSAAIERLAPEPGRLFLKIDADGREYDFLDQIIEANALLSGLVILFHDAPARLREIQVFVAAITEFMRLDNTTADNTAGVSEQGAPNVIEMTFSAIAQIEPHIPIAGATRDTTRLNAPNDPSKLELEIFYVS